MRQQLRTIIAIAAAGGLLALFLRNTDFHQVGREIARAELSLLVAALGTTALVYVFRAVRWQYLLRPFLLARKEGFSATAAFATIILERLLDTVMVLILFALFLLFFAPGFSTTSGDHTLDQVKLGGLVAAGACVVMLVVFFFLAGHPGTLERLTSGLMRVLPDSLGATAVRLVHAFSEGLGIVRQPGRLLMALALSVPVWLAIGSGIYLVTRAFHIDMPFSGTFLIQALLVVGVAVPTPGAVGGFHYFYRLGTTVFYGAPNDRAVGAALV